MTDEEFLNNLPSAAHLACFIGWMKELSLNELVGDQGIVHELIHLMDNTREIRELPKIRKQFESLLKLV